MTCSVKFVMTCFKALSIFGGVVTNSSKPLISDMAREYIESGGRIDPEWLNLRSVTIRRLS